MQRDIEGRRWLVTVFRDRFPALPSALQIQCGEKHPAPAPTVFARFDDPPNFYRLLPGATTPIKSIGASLDNERGIQLHKLQNTTTTEATHGTVVPYYILRSKNGVYCYFNLFESNPIDIESHPRQ